MKKIEQKEQIALMNWLNDLEHIGKILTAYANPNGGTRHIIEAVNLKKEGVKAGVSDITVVTPTKTLYIEMKRPPKILKNGKKSTAGIKTSLEQLDFIDKVSKNPNVEAKVCYGAKEAQEFVSAFI